MRFVDSHLHLDVQEAEDLVCFAGHAGAVLFACGVDEKTSARALELAKASPEVVKPFVGVHPSEAEKAEGLGWVQAALKSAAGVGEIGLDPTYSGIAGGGHQMETFTALLEAAQDAGKPVQVHARKAESKCIEVMGGYKLPKVLLHWLESEDALPRAMVRGYFVSFGPALLYSKRLQRIALRADPDLTLLESDFPVTYTPLGGVAGPMLIPSVAFKLAEVRGAPFTDTLERCAVNSLRYLGEKG